MAMHWILGNLPDGAGDVTSLGAAGLMGAMWLWERRTSQKREQQIDEAHGRIMSDRVQLEALMDVVRQNTQALSQLVAGQEQMLMRLGRPETAVGQSKT